MPTTSHNLQLARPGVAAAAALLASIALGPAAAEDLGPSLSGSTELRVAARLDDGRAGLASVSRLVLEARPAERASFRAEGSLELDYGSLSAFAVAREAGLASVSDLPPGVDPRREFSLDQAYSTILWGPMDIRAGLVPIAWGSAYAFNPSARVAAPRSPWDAEETEEGSPSADLSLSLAGGLSLEAYLAFGDRSGSLWPSVEEGEWGRLPWGAKLQYRGAGFDLSAGAICEVVSCSGADPARLWACADAVGSAGDLDLYVEAALRLDDSSFPDPEGGLEAAAGLAWALPAIDATLRLEYAHLGTGGGTRSEYDWAALLEGRAATLGRDYALAAIEREEADRWSVNLGVLSNLRDGSLAAAAEVGVRPTPVVELSAFCVLYAGDEGDEFDGRFSPGPGLELDLARPGAGLAFRMDF